MFNALKASIWVYKQCYKITVEKKLILIPETGIKFFLYGFLSRFYGWVKKEKKTKCKPI